MYAYPDPGHMAKNTRNLLAEYKNLWWPGKGWVQWKYVVALQELQNDHAFLVPAHKLTGRHINFHKNKIIHTMYLQSNITNPGIVCHQFSKWDNVPDFIL